MKKLKKITLSLLSLFIIFTMFEPYAQVYANELDKIRLKSPHGAYFNKELNTQKPDNAEIVNEDNKDIIIRKPEDETKLSSYPKSTEVIEKRTETSKTYEVGNHEYITELYPAPIHKKEKDAYVEIDNTLEKKNSFYRSTPSYENKDGNYDAVIRNGTAQISNDGKTITLSADGDMGHYAVNDNAILYNQIKDNVDMEYRINNDALMQKITFMDKPDSDTFTYKLHIDDLDIKQQDNTLILSNGKQEQFIIAAPQIEDALHETSPTDISYSKNKSGEVEVNVKMNREFMKKAQYPVLMSNDVHVNDQNEITVKTGYTRSLQADTASHYNQLFVGWDYQFQAGTNKPPLGMCRTHIKMVLPDAINKHQIIESASISLMKVNLHTGQGGTISVYETKNDMDVEAATWNTQEPLSIMTKLNDTAVNLQKGARTVFDITEYVKDLSQGEKRALALVSNPEDSNVLANVFWSQQASNLPMIVIRHRDNFDVDPNLNIDTFKYKMRVFSKKNQDFEALSMDGLAKPDANVLFDLYQRQGDNSYSFIREYTAPTEVSAKYIKPIYQTKPIAGANTYPIESINYTTDYIKIADFPSLDTFYEFRMKVKKGDEVSSGVYKTDGFILYKVKLGDTLKSISNYYNVSIDQIKADNNRDVNRIKEGDILFLRFPQNHPDIPADAFRPPIKTTFYEAKYEGLGPRCYGNCSAGDPVNTENGNFYHESIDFSLNDFEELSLNRYYNSLSTSESMFGRNFSSNLEQYVSFTKENDMLYYTGDGKIIKFKNHNGVYTSNSQFHMQANVSANSVTIKNEAQNNTYEFDSYGTLTSITNKQGFKSIINYNGYGQITSIQLGNKTINFSYNAQRLVQYITLPDASMVHYTYDKERRLTAFSDTSNKTETYRYDNLGRIKSIVDKNGTTLAQNEYDSANRVTNQIDDHGNHINFSYSGSKTIVTYNKKDTYTYEYNNHLLTKLTHPDKTSKTYVYDGNKNVIAETNEANEKTTYTYDSNNRKTSTTYPDGRVETMTYRNGELSGITNKDGTSEKYEYDARGNLLKTTQEDGSILQYEYNAKNQKVKEIDANGVWKTFEYTGNHITKINHKNGLVVNYRYDALGNLLSESDNMGHSTTYAYNKNNLVIYRKDSYGNEERYDYDANGQMTQYVDALGALTTYKYDASGNQIEIKKGEVKQIKTYDNYGRLTSETNEQGLKRSYTYDARNNKTSQTDEYGNTTTFTYDKGNRLLTTTDALGNIEKNEYQGNDLIRKTDTNGNVTEYVYDASHRLIETKLPNGYSTKLEYDDKGRTIKEINEFDQEATKEYDASGRISKEVDVKGIVTEHVYDHLGNEIKTIKDGIETSFEYDIYGNQIAEIDALGNRKTKTYDKLNRVIMETDAKGNSKQITYDAMGNIIRKTDENGAVQQSIYNKYGQLLQEIDALGNTKTYSYNNLGQVVKEVDAYGIETTYTYDHDQIAEIKTDGVLTSKTTYDTYGRKIKEEKPNEVLEYTYDKKGRIIEDKNTTTTLIKKTKYDSFGNVIKEWDNGDKKTTYVYDDHQRVISMEDESGRKATKVYDEYGNIIEQTEYDGTTTKCTYDTYGNVLTSTDTLGVTTYNTYNDLNQLETSRTGYVTTLYAYDENGKEISEYNSVKDAYLTKEYDKAGNLIKETDYAGNATTYTYDAKGQQIKSENALHQSKLTEYDALGRVISETDAAGNKIQKKYNRLGLLSLEVDERGFLKQYIYNENLQLIKTIDKLGNSTKIEYDEHGYIKKMIDSKDYETSFEYDIYGRKIKETLPSGIIKTMKYNSDGNIIEEDDGFRKTINTYNERGLLIYKDVNGKTKEVNTYNDKNQLIEKADELHNITYYTYDEFGNQTSEKKKNRLIQSSYDEENQLISQIENGKKEYDYEYDILGNQTRTIQNGKTIEENEYDELGNILEQTKSGMTTRYTYDEMNRMVEESVVDLSPTLTKTDTSIDNKNDNYVVITKLGYDEAGNIISAEDCYGNKVTKTYDALGNTTSVTNTNQHSTLYEYDERGNLIKVQNPMDRVLHLEYDKNDNLIKKTMNEQVTASYTYDEDNNLIKEVNEYGLKETFKYDDEHHVISYRKPDGTRIKMKYDAAGRLKQEGNRKYKYDAFGNLLSVKENYQEIKFTYDKFNRMTSYKDTEGNTISYTYDAFDRKTSIITPTNVISYTYNKYDEISSVKKDNKLIATYKYDKHGNVKQLKQGNYKTTYTYDNMDNVTSITHQKKKDVLTKLTYVYDGEGNVISETINDKENVYTYNEMEELATSSKYLNGKQVKTEYSYDLYGNQVETKNDGSFKKYEYNDNQQLEKITTKKGNTKLFYNKNGNISDIKYENGLEEHYTYDVYDQLTLLTNNKDHSYHYSYDPQGDRISIYKNIKDPLDTREWYQNIKNASIEEIREALKKEDSDDVFASLKEEHVYAKDAYKTCLYNEEKDPSDTLYETTINYILDKSEEHTQVLYENGKLNLYGNERLKSGDTTYLNGRNDTVIHAIRKGKDKQIEYEDFGYSDDLIKGYGYNGEAHDSSGLLYLRARYYNPQIARFIQIDSYEGEAENTQSQNRYSYVVNNPYKFIDPSGHKKKKSNKKKSIFQQFIEVTAKTVVSIMGDGVRQLTKPKSGNRPAMPASNRDVGKGTSIEQYRTAMNNEYQRILAEAQKDVRVTEIEQVNGGIRLRSQGGGWVEVPRTANGQLPSVNEIVSKIKNYQRTHEVHLYSEPPECPFTDIIMSVGKAVLGVAQFTDSIAKGTIKAMTKITGGIHEFLLDPIGVGKQVIDGIVESFKSGKFWTKVVGGTIGACVAIFVTGGAAAPVIIGGAFGAGSFAGGELHDFQEAGFDVYQFYENKGVDNFGEYLGQSFIFGGMEVYGGAKTGQGINSLYKRIKSGGAKAASGAVKSVKLEGRGSTGRNVPKDILEQAAMREALKNPFENIKGSREIIKVTEKLEDTRWLNWEKWQVVYRTNEGRNITIHFNYEPVKGLYDDFKFK